ncbi:hypothetical protein OE88DRAFT_913210 [Heliocybe sulcata]|uniref:Uncharacterized protein n=1 Tax=Heliocybe sulcata TaxID=5364 RepID=A0A5C3MY03_9AGAM|nr:hypothetical protein OE88DRAFT_913210 [Heliocybe sulcata]
MDFKCRFQPEIAPLWSFRLGFPPLPNTELDALYDRAKVFLLKQALYLRWAVEETAAQSSDYLLCIIQAHDAPLPTRLRLPTQGSAFLEHSKSDEWRSILENPRLFLADEADLTSEDPLRNIFLMLQAIYPGTLYIACQAPNGRLSGRSVPPLAWVQAHDASLAHVLGAERHRALLRVCRSHSADDIEMKAPRPSDARAGGCSLSGKVDQSKRSTGGKRTNWRRQANPNAGSSVNTSFGNHSSGSGGGGNQNRKGPSTSHGGRPTSPFTQSASASSPEQAHTSFSPGPESNLNAPVSSAESSPSTPEQTSASSSAQSSAADKDGKERFTLNATRPDASSDSTSKCQTDTAAPSLPSQSEMQKYPGRQAARRSGRRGFNNGRGTHSRDRGARLQGPRPRRLDLRDKERRVQTLESEEQPTGAETLFPSQAATVPSPLLESRGGTKLPFQTTPRPGPPSSPPHPAHLPSRPNPEPQSTTATNGSTPCLLSPNGTATAGTARCASGTNPAYLSIPRARTFYRASAGHSFQIPGIHNPVPVHLVVGRKYAHEFLWLGKCGWGSDSGCADLPCRVSCLERVGLVQASPIAGHACCIFHPCIRVGAIAWSVPLTLVMPPIKKNCGTNPLRPAYTSSVSSLP